jgi:hypothetical protein
MEGSVSPKMHAHRWLLGLALVLATSGLAAGQDPLTPAQSSGQSVTGAFEGWVPNQDGTFSLLVGYFNRNTEESMDIPIGPNNQIEPGGPDQGQPTHFLPGRAWGLFTITVPKDFGDKKLTWTITDNGKTSVIPLSLNVLWRLEPFKDADGDTPPYIGFSNDGPFVNGPIGQSETLTAKVGAPLPLTIWLADDAIDNSTRSNIKRPVATVHWIPFRGSAVKFDNRAPAVEKADLKSPPAGTPFNGKATTTVTFTSPGNYILDVQGNDATGVGGGGNQCCWTNAKVAVSVQP